MLQTTAKQHETLDEILYRTHGSSAQLAQMLELNPSLLARPRVPLGAVVKLPTPMPSSSTASKIELW